MNEKWTLLFKKYGELVKMTNNLAAMTNEVIVGFGD